jgi:uncharacterized protein DUF3159
MNDRSPSERLRRAVFTTQGIVDSLVGPLVFLVLYRTAGLGAAVLGAGAVALALLAWRKLSGGDTTTAWYGVAGVALGAALAGVTGSSDGYFLPKVVSNVLYGTGFLVSVVIGRPLIGVAWAFFHRQPLSWGYRPEVRRLFSALTLMWAGAHFFRAAVYAILIADSHDRTTSLATASVVLGIPLTAVLVAVTFLVIRRSLGPLPRPPAGRTT